MTIENNWWTTQYADSIIQYFFQKEETLPELLPHSPQLCMRRCLVDWLALIVEKFHICKSACHLAVYLLDHFMANHDIEESRLHLVAIGCLSIACECS